MVSITRERAAVQMFIEPVSMDAASSENGRADSAAARAAVQDGSDAQRASPYLGGARRRRPFLVVVVVDAFQLRRCRP